MKVRKRFSVTAKGNLDIDMRVTVSGSEPNIDSNVSSAKNVVFDMLRSQDYDVDKIVITDQE